MSSELKLGDAIQAYLIKSKLKGKYQALQITQVWETLMGKTISNYTDKIELFNNTLFIHTKIASLKQELNYQKTLIIQRVNEALNENAVKEVVIK